METADHRRLLADRLQVDLLGPMSEDEILDCRPTDRYLTGILFPGLRDTSRGGRCPGIGRRRR